MWRTGRKEEDIVNNGIILKLSSSDFHRVGYDEPYEQDDYISDECQEIEGVITGSDMLALINDEKSPEEVKWEPYKDWYKREGEYYYKEKEEDDIYL